MITVIPVFFSSIRRQECENILKNFSCSFLSFHCCYLSLQWRHDDHSKVEIESISSQSGLFFAKKSSMAAGFCRIILVTMCNSCSFFNFLMSCKASSTLVKSIPSFTHEYKRATACLQICRDREQVHELAISCLCIVITT